MPSPLKAAPAASAAATPGAGLPPTPPDGTAKAHRVLHVHNSADVYGASRSLVRLIKTLDRRRFTPLVVLPEAGPLKQLIEQEGVEVILHPRLSILARPILRSWKLALFVLNYPFSVLFLRSLIRQRHIDLVHTNTGVMPSAAAAARLAGIPHIWHVRDWFQEFRSFWPAYSGYMQRFSTSIIAVSNAIAGQFTKRDNVLVVHNGFDLEEFQVPKDNLRAEWRSRYQLQDHFVVGCVGRIKLVRKGQEILVKAAALLKQRDRPMKALIVGAPFLGNEAHLDEIQKLVAELGVADRVIFTGEVPDPRPAYAAMDVLAMTSAQPEPFGGVVMEAMSMGLPVIATNIGGSLDQVADGVTGLFVPPGDAEALADAIEKLMQNPDLCRRMGAAGVDRIRNQFSLVEMTRTMERIFEQSLAKP